MKEETGGHAYNSTSDIALADPSIDYAGKWHVGDFTSKNNISDADSGSLVANVTANSSATITVTIWIEGTLSAAKNAALNGMVDTFLKFVAI